MSGSVFKCDTAYSGLDKNLETKADAFHLKWILMIDVATFVLLNYSNRTLPLIFV